MSENIYIPYGNGITCIDSGYVRPGMAAMYLLEHDGEAAIIETATNRCIPRVLNLLKEKNIALEQVRYVIPTHIHLDHAGGAGSLLSHFPNAELIVHPRGSRHLIDPTKLIQGVMAVYGEEKYKELYGELVPAPKEKVVDAADGMELELAGRKLLLRHTPGHAEHHFCIWDETSKGWFTGDTFGLSYLEMAGSEFRHIIPTTTPVQFNPERLKKSIELIMSYEPERVFLTHFGMLEDVQHYADLLSQRVEQYCEVAKANQNESEPVETIEKAITDLECKELEATVPDMTYEMARELLAIDLNLNAQGLGVWLSRNA